MIEIKNLYSGYGKITVLHGVNITVKPNEIVALIGPNGAGKSTVIKSVFSIADKYKGKILYKGTDITNLKTHELMEYGISYVNQGHVVFHTLTIKENLEIGGELLDKEVVQKNLERVYERFPILKERKNSLAHTLSGGEQQMLAIGRALMHSPSLLMLDEPSLGLSPKLQKQIFKIISELRNEGMSILIVEQNAKKAIEMADRTYLLEDGRIALEGNKDIIKHKHIKNVYLGGRY